MARKTEKAIFFIVLVSLLLPLRQSPAQTSAPLKTDVAKEKLVAELERTIPDLMKKASIPGLTIAVVRTSSW